MGLPLLQSSTQHGRVAVQRRSNQHRCHAHQCPTVAGPACRPEQTRDNAGSGLYATRRALLSTLSISMGLLLSTSVGAATAAQPLNQEVDNDTSPYIQELKKRTEAMREERKAQRLKDYYKRNFKEYFEFEAGSQRAADARGIDRETQDAIRQWLADNK